MSEERDIFANFERMRREIDELFGDVWHRAGYIRVGQPSFSPRVDVYYCDKPPRVVVVAELAGVEVDEVNLQVQGSELLIGGERRAYQDGDRAYQQIEIESGRFERRVELGSEVLPDQARATYKDGMLRVILPVSESHRQAQSVPIKGQSG